MVSTFTVIAWAFSSRSTRRTQGGDFYLATRGDLELATSGYFPMAMDKSTDNRLVPDLSVARPAA